MLKIYRMLTDTRIKSLKPTDKKYKEADEKGMYLLIHPNGSKYWRLDYELDVKRNTLALGVYPSVTLKQAREKADYTRQNIRAGLPPKTKKAAKNKKTDTETTFGFIAGIWYLKHSENLAATTIKRLNCLLFRRILPVLKNRQIDEIEPSELIHVLETIEERSIEGAHRSLEIIKNVYDLAIAKGYLKYNIATGLSKTLKKIKKGHFLMLTSMIGDLVLEKIMEFDPSQPVIIITPHDQHNNHHELLNGVSEYFVTPVQQWI
jgi:hypothetical protein